MKSCHPSLKAAGLLGLRLAIGFIFIYMGLTKLVWNHAGSAAMFTAKIGLPGGGDLWAYVVGSLELLGGVMVVLGLWVRYAATWLAIIMLVAMATVHRGNPVTGYFLPLAVLGGCLGLLGTGAGRWRVVKTECHCGGCKETASGQPMSGEGEGCCGGGCGGGSCGSGMEEHQP